MLVPGCLEFTSEMSTATTLDDGAEVGVNWSDVPLMGNPAACESLVTSVLSGSKLVTHSGAFDSGIGDLMTRYTTVSK